MNFNLIPHDGCSYTYLQGSDILAGWTSNHGTSHTRTFEPNRNLVTGIQNLHGTNLLSSFDYTNDEIGRRIARIDTQPGSTATNEFGYNIRSELISAGMSTNLYSYLYDPIGNRQEAVVNSATNSYTANELNQYTSVSNGVAVEPTYDDDGNMLHDGGNLHFAWNGENRMVAATNGTTVVSNTYDSQGRRVRKQVTENDVLVSDASYLYNGWNLILEVVGRAVPSEPMSIETNRYTWGLDLSQTLQGSGGVGGLLLVSKSEEPGTTKRYAVSCDANGNISEYIDQANGTFAAHLEYDAFGRVIASTGTPPASFGFSTKCEDAETGLLYYGYRFYNPRVGRWLNRDPIQENGGFHLYAFCKNSSTTSIDVLGKMGVIPGKCCAFLDNPCESYCNSDEVQDGWKMRPKRFGFAFCLHGEKCFCLSPEKKKEYGARVAACMESHENEHLSHPNVDCKRPGLDPCQMSLRLWPAGMGPSRHEDECKAYKAELGCLNEIETADRTEKEKERIINVEQSVANACTAANIPF